MKLKDKNEVYWKVLGQVNAAVKVFPRNQEEKVAYSKFCKLCGTSTRTSIVEDCE